MSESQLVDAYLSGNVSRRTFVRRLVAAGLSVSAAVSYAHLLNPRPARAGSPPAFYGENFPVVTTNAATNINGVEHSARLNGRIDTSRCTEPTPWFFELEGPGGSRTVGGGTLPVSATARAVSAPIRGLLGGRDYRFRLFATANNGTARVAGGYKPLRVRDKGLRVAVDPATSVADQDGRVVLHGRVDPDGRPTTYYFRVGTSPEAHIWQRETPRRTTDPATGLIPVSAAISGLEIGRRYYFRLSASHPGAWRYSTALKFRPGRS